MLAPDLPPELQQDVLTDALAAARAIDDGSSRVRRLARWRRTCHPSCSKMS